eukprot:CAMPEP_0116543662 /NCGR_PEP_ID=MMETSP0397-20121206/1689_1 /TAXON_ID=216820 /ORGANISM="Cyclophora tenuis, Strain ECT3854" /LENGTH=235 /DNA_ID=CAMNT_0004067793 /DNA_START=9 /DNA_END=719 /DNA_ORIENTATION=-
MTCDGSERCSFGDEVQIYGKLNYNGTEDAGVVDGIVYATGKLTFLTLSYDLFNDLPFSMCGQWVQDADYQDDDGYVSSCPEDGEYNFNVPYTLPSSGDSTSWLATGWDGSGEIKLYSEKYGGDDDTGLVGDCVFGLKTLVSRSTNGSESGFWGGVHPPSAATATIAILVGLGLMLLACCYCACRRRRTATSSSSSGASTVGGRSSTFRNKLLDDDDDDDDANTAISSKGPIPKEP